MEMSPASQEDHGNLHMHDQEGHVEYAKRWLTTHKQWMLIFDNANSDIDFERDYFPDTPDGVIILNGRQQRLKTKIKGPVRRILELQPLSPSSAIELFMRSLATHEEERVEASETMKDIVEYLNGIPLAIELAVPKIRKLGLQVSLRNRLEIYRKNLDDLYKGRSTSEEFDMRATQVDQLLDFVDLPDVQTQLPNMSRVSKDAFALLQLLSCLGPGPLSVRLLESSWKNWKIARSTDYRSYPQVLKDYETNSFSTHVIQKAISLLDELCLIQITSNEDNIEITFNTFVKGCIIDRMTSKGIDRHTTTLSALTMLVQSISWEDDLEEDDLEEDDLEEDDLEEDDLKQWTLPIRLLPHLRAIIDTSDEEIANVVTALCQSDGPEVGLDFASKVGMIHFQGGFLEDAEEIQKLAESKARDILGVYHGITLRAMSEIATTYMIKDKPEEALKIREEVFTIRKDICERQLSLRFVASCIFRNLYQVIWHWLPWRAAIPDFCGYPFEGIIRLLPVSWIGNSIQRNPNIIHRNSLAYQQISMNLADSLAALPSLKDKEKALSIRRNIAYQRMSIVRRRPKRSYLKRRIEASRKVASSLRDLRQYPKSFYLRKKVYNLCEREQFARRSLLTLKVKVIRDLSESFMDMGNDVAALELSQDVSNTLKQLVEDMFFPENHVQIIMAERDLGHRHSVMNDLCLAQKIYEDVEEKCLKLFGLHHRLSIDAAENVAFVKDRRGNVEDALEKQRTVILERPKSHSDDLLNSLELAASIVINQQNLASLGPKLQYYVINTRNRQHHKNEICILESLNHLANCLNSSDEAHYSNVEGDECKLCNEAQYVRSKVLFKQASYPNGIKHIDTLMTMSGLADDYDTQYQIHMRPEESPLSSQSGSRQLKASISISARDPSSSATQDSVQSFDNELRNDLLDEWNEFLKDDYVEESVFESLATDAPLEPIVSVHRELHISSLDALKRRSLALREHVLEQIIANGKMVATKGKDTEAWKADNRLVRRAERKLAESRDIYGLNTDQHERYDEKRISGWLEHVDPGAEGSETRSLTIWPPVLNDSSLEEIIEEPAQDNTRSNKCTDKVEDDPGEGSAVSA